MLPGHRLILEAADTVGQELRAYVESERVTTICPELGVSFRNMLQDLLSWRTSHQKRGAHYLKETPGTPTAYVSTGLVIGLDARRDIGFVNAMQTRIDQTLKEIDKMDRSSDHGCPTWKPLKTTDEA